MNSFPRSPNSNSTYEWPEYAADTGWRSINLTAAGISDTEGTFSERCALWDEVRNSRFNWKEGEQHRHSDTPLTL